MSDTLYVANKATLNNGLQVSNGETALQTLSSTELAVADETLKVTKDEAKFKVPVTLNSRLTVADTITATETFADNTKNNLVVKKANVETLSSAAVTATTVSSDDLNQKVNDAYYDVPVIFVQPQKSKTTEAVNYQLQIVRANILPEQLVD